MIEETIKFKDLTTNGLIHYPTVDGGDYITVRGLKNSEYLKLVQVDIDFFENKLDSLIRKNNIIGNIDYGKLSIIDKYPLYNKIKEITNIKRVIKLDLLTCNYCSKINSTSIDIVEDIDLLRPETKSDLIKKITLEDGKEISLMPPTIDSEKDFIEEIKSTGMDDSIIRELDMDLIKIGRCISGFPAFEIYNSLSEGELGMIADNIPKFKPKDMEKINDNLIDIMKYGFKTITSKCCVECGRSLHIEPFLTFSEYV